MFILKGHSLKVRAARVDDPGCDRLMPDVIDYCVAVEGQDLADCVVLVLDTRTGKVRFREETCGHQALTWYTQVAAAAVKGIEADQEHNEGAAA